MIEIQVLNRTQRKTKQATISTYKFELPTEPTSAFQVIGVDPGVCNLGIAVLSNYGNVGYAYQVSIPRLDDPVKRIENYRWIMMDCELLFAPPIRVIVEGSAYSKWYRQTELAEARTSIVIWLSRMVDDIRIIQPNSIRKAVFGDGKLSAHDYWSGLPKDCLAALSCAYYASDHWEESDDKTNL